MASSLIVLIAHLLKWEFQPERRTRSWLVTVRRERSNIAQQVALRQVRTMDAHMDVIYLRAARLAAKESGLSLCALPDECPYDIVHLCDQDWLPR